MTNCNGQLNYKNFRQNRLILVILHGWQSSKEKWQKVKENLEKRGTCPERSEGVRVIVPDLPGFRKETELKKVWDLDDYVDWFKEFSLESNPPFFILGHSFGGRIAIKFAAKNPEKLKGLILVSAAGIKHKKTFRQNLLFKMAKAGGKFSFLPFYAFFRKAFYKFIVREKDYIQTKGYLKETFKKTISEDLTGYLEKVKTPTLIIWGDKDKETPLADAYLMKEKIKDSEIKILKDIGHSPHRDTPKKLSEIILKFLKQ